MNERARACVCVCVSTYDRMKDNIRRVSIVELERQQYWFFFCYRLMIIRVTLKRDDDEE